MNEETRIQPDTQEEIQEMTALQRMLGVYFSPRKTFEYLREKPKWLVPLVIIIVIFLLYGVRDYVLRDLVAQESIDKITMIPQIPEEQKGEIIEKIKQNWTGSIAYLSASQVAGKNIFLWALEWVAFSAILLFLGNFLLGGQASFVKLLSVYVHAGLVAIPATLLKIPLMLIQHTLHIQTSLAIFIPADIERNVLHILLERLDIFTAWEVILIIIGLSAISRFSISKATALVIPLWIFLDIFIVIKEIVLLKLGMA